MVKRIVFVAFLVLFFSQCAFCEEQMTAEQFSDFCSTASASEVSEQLKRGAVFVLLL